VLASQKSMSALPTNPSAASLVPCMIEASQSKAAKSDGGSTRYGRRWGEYTVCLSMDIPYQRQEGFNLFALHLFQSCFGKWTSPVLGSIANFSLFE